MRQLRGGAVSYIPQDPGTALNPALRMRHAAGGDSSRRTGARCPASERDARDARGARRGRAAIRRRVPPPLPAPALGRPAAARRDRDGVRLPAARDRLRRADDRARRDDAGARARDHPGPLPQHTELPRCTSATTSRSSPSSPTRSRSCTPGGSSSWRPATRCSRLRGTLYTRRLLRAVPDLERQAVGASGSRATRRCPAGGPPGCFFAPRCTLASGRLPAAFPPVRELGDGHLVRCYHADEARRRCSPSGRRGRRRRRRSARSCSR